MLLGNLENIVLLPYFSDSEIIWISECLFCEDVEMILVLRLLTFQRDIVNLKGLCRRQNIKNKSFKEPILGNLPCGPVVKAPRFHCRGRGSIPGRGTKIPYATWPRKTKKKKKKDLYFENIEEGDFFN